MGMTNAAAEFLATDMIGGTVVDFSNANAHIGVGDGTLAFDKTQTDLQGTNKLRKAMDTGFPARSGAQMTFQATFGTADANWAWQEWGIFNAATGGVMFNREVENLGTKTSAVTWVFQVKITLTV
jgi:hypothetical protein